MGQQHGEQPSISAYDGAQDKAISGFQEGPSGHLPPERTTIYQAEQMPLTARGARHLTDYMGLVLRSSQRRTSMPTSGAMRSRTMAW